MSKRALIAGPWIGEFGWELFCWQGVVRKESLNYDAIIIVSGPGKQAMYSDILDKFGSHAIYHEFDCGNPKTDAWKVHGKVVNDFDVREFLSRGPIQEWLSAQDIKEIGHMDGRRDFQEKEGIYYDYSRYQPITDYKIVLHARNKLTGTQRNWTEDKYNNLVDLIENNSPVSRSEIAFIGSNESFCVEGCADKRGVTLDETIRIFKGTDVVIGPSSGPMHLASLCRANHIVWGICPGRYTHNWNPFGTPCIFIPDATFQIEPEKIFHTWMSRDTLYHRGEKVDNEKVKYTPSNEYTAGVKI